MSNNRGLIIVGVGCAVVGLLSVCCIGFALIYKASKDRPTVTTVQTPTTAPTPPVQTDSPIPPANGFQQVQGEGFAYNIPSGWQPMQSQSGLPMHGSKVFPGRTVNIVTEPFVGTAVAYHDASLRGLRNLSHVSIVAQRASFVGSLIGFEIESKWRQNGATMHLSQLGTVKNGKGYVLTCGDLASRFAGLADAECRAIFGSFRVF